MEQLVNNVVTTLSAGINNSVTSISVVDGSFMPSSGNFRILIDNELILVTARSSNTLTVSRGSEGSTAASHSSGASVSVVLTKAALEQLFADYQQTGLLSALPSAGKTGRWYCPTDSHVKFRDNGSSWDAYGISRKLVQPPTSGWTTVNIQNQTITSPNDGVLFTSSTSAATGLTGYFRTLPSSPYVVTCGFTTFYNLNNVLSSQFCGFGLRDSASGKVVAMYEVFEADGEGLISVDGWVDLNNFNSTYINRKSANKTFETYFRIEDDNTNRIFSISTNGINFATFFSQSRITHMTPDQVGFIVLSQSGGGAKFTNYET